MSVNERTTIKFGDQVWKITPFHFVVGDPHTNVWSFDELSRFWRQEIKSSVSWPLSTNYTYPTRIPEFVKRLRVEYNSALFYTDNPLVVNELQSEEVTLAAVEDGKLILTNFADLPGIENAMKVYALGEFWLSYAEGGAERALRFNRPRVS